MDKIIMKQKFSTVFLLALLTSCGGGGGSSTVRSLVPPTTQPTTPETPALVLDGSNIQGVYLAKFMTLNSLVVGTIPGSAQFRRVDDRIWAYVRLFAGAPEIGHFQNVHSGNRCPVLPGDDTNRDGYIDIKEALAVVGPVIVPLDADLSTQLAGNKLWSKSFLNGSYDYMSDTNFDSFLANLKEEDENPIDLIGKIPGDIPFEISGKVFMVQGIAAGKELPPSVASLPRYLRQQTLPIACGVYKPISTESGVVYEDVITGPVAPVEETIDQPAPVGADEIPATATEEPLPPTVVGPSEEPTEVPEVPEVITDPDPEGGE